MTTILFAFVLSCVLSLCLTPLARSVGTRFGALDLPGERKIHSRPIPRIGGAAIFLAFILTVALLYFTVHTEVTAQLTPDARTLALAAGAVLCFATGVWDDFRGLPAWVKLLLQIGAATLAFCGGLSVERVAGLSGVVELGLFSYPLTVLWFLAFINAINLIDGLDGLAGGVTLFAALVMVVLASMSAHYLAALLFAVLAGAILGFLRYNFHPATIFLGDGGSYFLGFTFAGVALYGSMKSQVGTALLIPMIAMGLPLFDTILSSLRRFLAGKRIFGADRDHIHHRLLALGLNTQRAVLLMYGVSVGMGLLAILLVHVNDERAAVILLLLAVGAVAFARKLGYFDYFSTRHMLSWLGDLSETTGISRERRIFLSLLVQTSHARSLTNLWQAMSETLAMLEFDQAMLYLSQGWDNGCFRPCLAVAASQAAQYTNRRLIPVEQASVCLRQAPPEFKWQRPGFEASIDTCSRCLYRLELPLVESHDTVSYGTLVLIKDGQQGPLSLYSLKRIEHLRRSVVRAMDGLCPSS
ncbi:MAG: hypothetical protein BWK76_22515 [Desulfobulbaceae bacterium A2]|nr:MAG: hypothetical protein BWK76_22515 [Desulfobulbaceae bacterium A2]